MLAGAIVVGKNWNRITNLENDMSDVADKIEKGFERIYDKMDEVKDEVSDVKERMASVETQVKLINGKR